MVIGIGLDIVEIPRFEEFLARHRERAVRRLFTDYEVSDSEKSEQTDILYAQRFAAKEALMKALKTGWGRGIRFADINVRLETPPQIELIGAALRTATERGVRRIWLSLSEEPPLAVATVILEGD